MRPVVLSRRAIEDLVETRDYLEAARPGAGAAMVSAIARRLWLLEDNPHLGPVYQEWPIYRRLVHRNYLLFYSVTADQVRVERVIHGARDVLAVLLDAD